MSVLEQRVTAGTIENANGVTLIGEIDRMLQATEEAIQRYINENGGALPQKGFEIQATIQIGAESERMRRIQFGVSRKEPKVSTNHSMFGHVRDGVLLMESPARQQGFDFTAAALKAAEEAGE